MSPEEEKQIFIRLFLNMAFGVASMNCCVRGGGGWALDRAVFYFPPKQILVLLVSTCDSFIVQLCAGLQRLEGLSASKLAEWTSFCDSLICVDPAP